MTVQQIIEMGLVNDMTKVFIRKDCTFMAHGNWYQDNVLEYVDREVKSFTWQNDGKFYIDIEGGEGK